jgi:hypothetical protein
MLIDILRMPPAFGIPIDRQHTITNGETNDYHNPRTVVWQGLPIYGDRLNVGAKINKTPSNLFKAIHVSDDSTHVFETVFSMEHNLEETDAVCLYTKVISSSAVRMAVSLDAVRYYHVGPHRLLPISHFLLGNRLPSLGSGGISSLTVYNPVENLVPPILDLNLLQVAFTQALELGPDVLNKRLAHAYYPIYAYTPGVMQALLNGRFHRSPFSEIPVEHPNIQIPRDKWFRWENVQFAVEARGMRVELNHPAFSGQVMNIMSLTPTKFQITASLFDVLEGHTDCWLASYYEDSYSVMGGFSWERMKQAIKVIMDECLVNYCRLHLIDYSEFMYNMSSKDRSSINISKNIYDEVEITFHDQVHDRYVCYYSSFPTLALSTLSVGWHG